MPRKVLPARTLYVSRPMPLTKGAPSLSDLSEARFDSPENRDLVMPDVYRAPEVILGMPWSYSIDLWGFAMMVRLSFPRWSNDRAYHTIAVGFVRAKTALLCTRKRWTILRASTPSRDDIDYGVSSIRFSSAFGQKSALLGRWWFDYPA